LSNVVTVGTDRRRLSLSLAVLTEIEVESVVRCDRSSLGVTATLDRLDATITLDGDDGDGDADRRCSWSLTEEISWCSGMDGCRTSVLGELDVDCAAEDDRLCLGEPSDVMSEAESTSECWSVNTFKILQPRSSHCHHYFYLLSIRFPISDQ